MPGVWFKVIILSASAVLFAGAAKNYGTALQKSILFYDAQRSGKLPANNPISWRGHSALNACVVGGWYDAGDHIKFGLPMSYTATALLWSLVRFKDGYRHARKLDEMYAMIKWPLDYFLKAWNPKKNVLTVQVGDGTDHDFWGRAEDMTMHRPCQVVSTTKKGSDIAAGTAAALAAGSIAFKDKGDKAYSNKLLSAAETLYAFAKDNRGLFKGATEFYDTSGDKDELCEASVWLYKATRRAQFLTDAKSFFEQDTAWAYSWDSKQVACQLLLFEETKDNKYRAPVVAYFKDWMPGGGVAYTPCKLAWRAKWSSNRYAAILPSSPWLPPRTASTPRGTESGPLNRSTTCLGTTVTTADATATRWATAPSTP